VASDPDVIIIGAGMAGLAAASELARSSLSVCILEARERIGGRVFTKMHSGFEAPIELGAEFIHGKPCEIWDPLQARSVEITEVDGTNWCVTNGRLAPCEFFSQVESILDKMNGSGADESFLEFLQRCCGDRNDEATERVKRRALGYVSGFNAADPALVGVHWLVKEMRAEEEIEGERAFRSTNGYDDLLGHFRRELSGQNVMIRTGTVVESVEWSKGRAEVKFHDSAALRTSGLRTKRVLVTVPLGVLKATAGESGAIRFAPQLPEAKLDALEKLEMGKVIRIVLRFRTRFWEKISPVESGGKNLSDMSFLFSEDEWFPTWWTTMPEKLPIITGWAPFRCAERLSGRDRSFVVEHSLRTLSELLKVSFGELEQLLVHADFHDWQTDPFARGAYSYAKVGSDGAPEALGAPVESTLFFAGEATDSEFTGTVHAAISSGYRAARDILQGIG
jgi:monoamine oxidase